MRRTALIAIAFLGCRGALAADLVAPVSPEESSIRGSGRITVIEENDALMPNPTDRWYTQGVEFSYLSTPIVGTGMDKLMPGTYVDPGTVHERRFEVVLGQTLFTPENLRLDPPDPRDRPYAGWLYAGLGLYQENDRRTLDHLEVLIGVVGPAALGATVQDDFHGLLGQITPPGWQFQLKNEPGVVLSYERKWRFDMALPAGLSVDAIPEAGATVGNIFTYGETGALLRFGQNLKADYGPARIRPALSGTTWFDPSQLEGPVGWYVFVGAQGRAVARNIFLQGNTFESSPSVEMLPLVADLSTGVSLFWADFAKVDFIYTSRTQEFVGQRQDDRFGGIDASFRLP